jgi:hypothetical protein
MVFLKVPRLWIEDEKYAQSLEVIASNFMRGSTRIVSVIFYVTSNVIDVDNMAEILSVREIPTQRTDFGIDVDWRLFPTTPVEGDAPLMSIDWFRLR